jgi:hypothetical protein
VWSISHQWSMIFIQMVCQTNGIIHKIMKQVKKKHKQALQNCQDNYRINWVQITYHFFIFPLYTSINCIAQYYNHWTGTKIIKWSTKHSAIFKWCGERVWKNIIKDILLSLS